MDDSGIENVADTAFLVAHYRAAESARPDALFRDPLAGSLAGEHGRKLAQSWPTGRLLAWSVALRTVIIDDYIRAAVNAGTDTIVNLGAGLDTRPYRLELPPSLRWIEVDQPRVVDYKQEQLKGQTLHCRLESFGLDLADAGARRNLLARIADGSTRALVLTEGVVPYLENAEVAALARDLRAHPCYRSWIVEYTSPLMARLRRRVVKRDLAVLTKNAPLKFEPSDWAGFYLDLGWRAAQIRYFPDEGLKRRRSMPLPFLKRWGIRLKLAFSSPRKRDELRKLMGFALLEPASQGL